jgi:uncharacterized membrane protein
MMGFFSHMLSWFGALEALFFCFRACLTAYFAPVFSSSNQNYYVLNGIIIIIIIIIIISIILLLVFTCLVRLQTFEDEIRDEEICYEVQKEKYCTDK